jgi:hypothetical protein
VIQESGLPDAVPAASTTDHPAGASRLRVLHLLREDDGDAPFREPLPLGSHRLPAGV